MNYIVNIGNKMTLCKGEKCKALGRRKEASYNIVGETKAVFCKDCSLEGKPHNVPCIFQIWVKKDFDREAIVKLTTEDFTFVKKSDSPDISFRRVGVYAGKIDKEIAVKSEESHYFIRLHNPEALMRLEALTFDFNNTVGPKSISKQEILKAYNS